MLSAISQAPLLPPGTPTRSKAQRGTPEAPDQAPPLPSLPHLPLPDPPPPRRPLHCRACSCSCVSPALLWAARPLLWLHLLWELPPKSCSSCTCTHVHTHALHMCIQACTRVYRYAHKCSLCMASVHLPDPPPPRGRSVAAGRGGPACGTNLYLLLTSTSPPPPPRIWLQQIETGKHSRTRTLAPLRPKHDSLALQTPFTPPSTSPPCAFL